MKVAYFAHAANLTGANRSLIDLTSTLKGMGVVPIVFLPCNGPIETELKSQRIKYYVMPYKPWYYNVPTEKSLRKRIKHIFREPYNFLMVLKVAKIIRKERVELIHSNSILIGFGGQVASLVHIPHVWHIREFMEEDHHNKFDNERIAIPRLRKATALVAVSEVVAEKFSKKLMCKVLIVYNGVNVKKYSLPDKKILKNPRIELMISGRILESKGQMEAVKAIEILKNKQYNIILRIIGDGTNEGELERIQTYIREHHLEDVVEHIPFQTDLSTYNNHCDIQLVCSHNEAFGRVTVEGMLAHSLVIGADAGCTSYLIRDGETGILYTCGNPQSLADKIEWAITHKKQAQEIANSGYNQGKQYSINKTADEILQIYNEILK